MNFFLEIYELQIRYILIIFSLSLFLLPIAYLIFKKHIDCNDYKKNFYEINGKIGRKDFIINCAILTTTIYVLTALNFLYIIYINIFIPFIELILYYLLWFNISKRIYAITDKKKLSFICGMAFGLLTIFCLISEQVISIYKYWYLIVDVINLSIWILLMTIPNKSDIQQIKKKS